MTIDLILKSLSINRIYFSRSAVCAMFQCYLKHFVLLFETPKTTHFLQNLNIFCTKNQCFWWNFVVKSKDFHDFLEILPTLRGSFSMTNGSTPKKNNIFIVYIARAVYCAMFWVDPKKPNRRLESMKNAFFQFLAHPTPPLAPKAQYPFSAEGATVTYECIYNWVYI